MKCCESAPFALDKGRCARCSYYYCKLNFRIIIIVDLCRRKNLIFGHDLRIRNKPSTEMRNFDDFFSK